MTEDRLIELAAQIGLGRAMKPIGMQTGDVFATEQGYRTGELLAFAAAVTAAERERWTEAVMAELDGNGQAQAIVAYATRA